MKFVLTMISVSCVGAMQLIQAQPADLLCLSLSYSVPSDVTRRPDGPLPVNRDFIVTAVIGNDGLQRAGSFSSAVYLSRDSAIDANADIFLGSLSLASLDARSSRTVQRRFRLPSSLSKMYFGRVYLGIVVDRDNRIFEVRESNNRNRGEGRDRRVIELFDPVVPHGTVPISFLNRTAAVRWLHDNGFHSPLPRLLDIGWSRPLTISTFSRFNGRTMPPAAFRIQATDPPRAPPYELIVYGSEPGFDPVGLRPDIGEPSPRTAVWYGLRYVGWRDYVQRYHDRF